MNKLDQIALQKEYAKRHAARQAEAALSEARQSAVAEIPGLIERLLDRLEALGAPDAKVVKTLEKVPTGKLFKRYELKEIERAAWFVCVKYANDYRFVEGDISIFDLVVLSNGTLQERMRTPSEPDVPGECFDHRVRTYDPIAVREGLELLIDKYGA